MNTLNTYLKVAFFTASAFFLLASSCNKEAPLVIDESGNPVLNMVKIKLSDFDTLNVTCGQTVILDAEVQADHVVYSNIEVHHISAKYFWSHTGDTSPTITITHVPDRTFRHYEVMIIDSQVVTYDDSSIAQTDTLIREVVLYGRHLPLYVIPNAFTPNDDGWNDSFKITAVCFNAIHLKIFDTYSNSVIFESYDIDRGWDGTHKGKKMPSGEYRYKFEITSIDNTVSQAEGFMQLIR